MPATYSKPPCVEAVCEFRFDPASPWDLTMPGLMYRELAEHYPNKRETKAIEVEFDLQSQSPVRRTVQSDQIQLLSRDEKSKVQVGRHLLVVSRVAPYEGWQNLKPMIDRALDCYRKTASPSAIVRTSLRYVNSIVIPHSEFMMEDYFDFYPFIGPRLPQEHGAFFLGVETAYSEQRDALRVEIQTAQSGDPNSNNILLTLNYAANGKGKVSFDSVNQWLDTAHSTVHDVFEGCIKDLTRRLFEPILPCTV